MTTIRPIRRPFTGERVVALSPENATEATRHWLRRPNVFPGRALTAQTLAQRQAWQAGRIATRGQDWVAGVADGLYASFDMSPVEGETGMAGARLRIEPGRGLCVSGEDAVLTQPLECRLADIPVVAPPGFFVDGSGVGDTTGDGSLNSRAIGAALGALNAAALGTLPAIGVLLLQPVTVDTSNFDPMDPCDRSACDEGTVDDVAAFEDWRIADAVRLLWYVWPSEWQAVPAVAAAQLRSALAWTVFQAEAALPSDAVLPWEGWGLPIAMVGLGAGAGTARQPAWLDRASVVRQGGLARDARLQRAGTAVAANSRLPSLWQAQIEQFAEQIALAGDPAPAPGDLAAAFGTLLPPVGLLPSNAFDPATHRSDFFPGGFDLDAAPVPVDQLDLAVRASAGLAPLNLSAAESVRLLVPVPLQVWEPRLLVQETIDPEFDATLQHFLLNRSRALGARQGLRVRGAVLQHALGGQAVNVTAFDNDPDALEPETLEPWGPPPAGGGHRSTLRAGLHQHGFEGATSAYTVDGPRLYVWVCLHPDQPPRTLLLQWRGSDGSPEHRAYWGENLIDLGTDGSASKLRIGDLPAAGDWVRLEIDAAAVGLAGAALDGMAFLLFDGQAAFGEAGGVGADGLDHDWFGPVPPTGAHTIGDEPWETQAPNDLWTPFEPTSGVLPLPASAPPPTPGAHRDERLPGLHQHFIEGVAAPFAVAAGESLFCWVLLDPNAPPQELMLQWHTAAAGWEHRAFWGSDVIAWGAPGQPSRLRGGALPQPGTWVRLAVTAKSLGLEGAALDGIAFTQFDGMAAFGAAGAFPVDANGAAGAERVWFAGELPAGAVTRGTWNLISAADMGNAIPAVSEGQVQAVADLYAHPALQVLSAQERAQLYTRGIENFAAYLRSRADRADDLVDHGFVKVQADVYRVRQLMLGSTAASRLVVSPALASIAQADTAVASQTQIADFIAELKLKAGVPAPAPAPAPAPRPGLVGTIASVPGRALNAVNTSLTLDLPGVLRPSPIAQAAQGAVSIGGLTGARGGSVLLDASRISAGSSLGSILGSPLGTPVIRQPVGDRTSVGLNSDIIGNVFLPPRVRVPTPTDVSNADPLVGTSFIRTTTIAKRLEDPKAKEARDYTTSSRYQAVLSLVDLADELTAEDGGVVPGLFDGIDVRGLEGDGFLDDVPPVNNVKPLTRPFADFLVNRALLPRLLQVPSRVPARPATETQIADPDEASMFSDTTDLADHSVALMRKMEGRIKLYRDAIAACQDAGLALRSSVTAVTARLNAMNDELAEARHDVSVARALIAEEQQRLDTINARRARVLAEEVKFIAFIRPRETVNLLATPTHAVDPGLVDAPVPACQRDHPDVPSELDDMLRVVREAPAAWFVNAPPLLHRLDRIDLLVRTLQTAQVRSLAGLATPLIPAASASGKVATAIARVASRQAEALAPRATAIRTLDIAQLATTTTWQGVRVQAEQVVSFADLADGGHGRADVARSAAQELEGIRNVVACLHSDFSGVLPVLRLEWAQRLSEFDAAPNLRNLATLPRWNELAEPDRTRMQAYVDWLFAQTEPSQSQAGALINDVVRMALLLASHAPVDRIVAGRLARPQTGVRPGIRIPLTVLDPSRLRVGMPAVLWRGSSVVARATVEDLGQAEVSARVTQTLQVNGQEQVDLGDDVRVQFDDSASLSIATASAARTLFGR